MENRLPEGWLETTLGESFKIERGGSPRPIENYLTNDENGINWIKIGDTKNISKYISFTKEKIKPEGLKRSRMVYEGDFILSNSMSFGRPYIMKTNGCIHDGWLVIRKNDKIDTNFLYYHLSSSLVYEQFSSLAKGSTVKNLNIQAAEKVKIVLPPLNKQLEIAARLDTFFAHLETAKKGLEQIPVLLKQFRQAVLTKAVTGKLTEEWRNEKELNYPITKKTKKISRNLLDDKSKDFDLFNLPNIWKWKTISDVSDIKGGKRLPKGESLVNYDTGLPYIKAGDLKKGTVLFDKLEYLLPETHKKIKNYIISKGDVYITNVGACIGDSGIIPEELDGANLTENALKMCNHEGVINKYLAFWLQSPIAQKFIQQSILSAAQGKLALGRVEVFPIPLCSLQEQIEIVRHVEILFSRADTIEAQYKKLKAQIDQLPQAILAKAFRGELLESLGNETEISTLLEQADKLNN